MSKLSDYYSEGFEQPENLEEEEFALIPTGWYPVEITGVEIKDNASGSGARFIVKFTIFGEKHAKRNVWNGAGFNFIHSSQQCQAIGQRELGRLTKACGYKENDRLMDEEELIGKTLDVYIETEEGQNGYKDKNVAKKFAPIGHGGKADTSPKPSQPAPATQAQVQTPSGAQQASPAPSQTPAGAGKRPWEK